MSGFGRRGSILAVATVLLSLAAAGGGEGHATTAAAKPPWQGTWTLKLLARNGPDAKKVALVVKQTYSPGKGYWIYATANPVWGSAKHASGSLIFFGASCGSAPRWTKLCATKDNSSLVAKFGLDGYGKGVGYSGGGLIVAKVTVLPGHSEQAVLKGTLYTAKRDKQGRLAPNRAIATIVATRLSTDWRLACTENWWSGTWLRTEHEGEATFKQSGRQISGSFTWFGGGSFGHPALSDDCREMSGTTPTTAQLKAADFTINLLDKDHFTGHWRWKTTPKRTADGSERWDGTFSGASTSH